MRLGRLSTSKFATGGAMLLAVLAFGHAAHAANPITEEISRRQAGALHQLIAIGVQQGISALPPTTGQSFVYEWDPAVDTYVRSSFIGPVSFRTPDTIGRGRFALRTAASYFELSRTFQGVDYQFDHVSGDRVFTRIGLRASAQVALFDLALTYGLRDGVEIAANLPITVVTPSATQIYASFPEVTSDYGGIPTRQIDDALRTGGKLMTKRNSLATMGAKGFSEATQAGVGRTSLLAKVELWSNHLARLAFASEVFFPSPSEAEFAGTDTFAILPRFVAAVSPGTRRVQLLIDAGYDYDFDIDELRRFVWNSGVSLAFAGLTFDAGVGGSQYDRGVSWTPPTGHTPSFKTTSEADYHALSSTNAGDTLIDFLGGFKLALGGESILAASVSVPLNDEGFRPAVAGTVAFEVYF